MISADLLQATVNAARLAAAMAIEGHIYSTPAVIAHLQGSTASFYEITIGELKDGKTAILQQPPVIPPLVIADPRTDDRTVHAAKEIQNTCFNCGKTGHWVKDCKAQSKWPKDSLSPKGEANRVHIINSATANSDSDPNFDDLTDPDPTAKFENENFYNILRQMAAEMDTKEEETATA
jgi:hypothetical protein